MNGRPLKDFIAFLAKRYPDLSQSEIGRRANLSQSLINKIALGGAVRRPAMESYVRLARTFQADWQDFLRTHPNHDKKISEMVLCLVPGLLPTRDDPGTVYALRLLREVFRESSTESREVVLSLLRTMAVRSSGRSLRTQSAGVPRGRSRAL